MATKTAATEPRDRSSARIVLEGVGIVVISGLLGWVGLNAHTTAVELRGISTRVDALMEAYTRDVSRLDGGLTAREREIEGLRARLRILEMQGRRPQE